MKKIIAVVLSFGLITTAFANLPTPTPTIESLNSIVAVVNNEVVTQNEFDAALLEAKQQLAASQNPNAIDNDKLKQMVLQQLIDQKLQLQIAKRAGITVSDAQVTQGITHLASMNKLTLSQLKEKLEKDHVPFDQYRALIRRQLMVHQAQESAVGSTVHVTQADLDRVQAMYQAQMGAQQQYDVIDVLSPDKMAAQKIVAQLKNGADIQAVAPDNINELGWKSANELPTVFLQQLKQMKPGDVAGPIVAANGYHVIKLVGVRGNNAKTLSHAELQNYAFNMKMQKAVAKWVEKLRSTAYINTTPRT
ncbi:MAG: hypothetical protein A3I77_03400 [Gammaproteobacteria bacterium RIFCSPLOWO2_02_FULL_42_14]|nr:MAG: hypothetical protein A3B71_01380 [Gammaproteobacteria bacterium RIFCSPHIGHO2_02_FULL_42_43]OGT28141.1 MAG: hypothetical protein A2624_02005 [Gammaproteobacteria bacterium RIFCSPHIGHO2_01_FULL_42_8]OGT51719.1 MAG: hypothetical protein A3E54_03595 [Gammaproteobacteria bacterium RIFCSPHIGHO2_12_FULL_41_25]OGT61616.1 MAG: hypothetical protein A3I77_03400 [Gammaproteobacteria bacterium RIFCSPLOWO2_02_FULL_42_14]OGT86240.1 MAG: hypothetical protein A3G86_06250 [Gammaproteobacteria bacterium R